MLYIRAGVYAEGPTDYAFLIPLLDRLLDTLAARLFPASYEVAPTAGIDAPDCAADGRAVRAAAAMAQHWDTCTLFVIHADGAGEPERARRFNVEPVIAAAQAQLSDRTLPVVACVPVREVEAWMLVDCDVFRQIIGSRAEVQCPAEPERDLDPKATLHRILKEGGVRRPPARLYAFFGERVSFDALRTLPAFQRFELDLVSVLRDLQTAIGRRS